MGPLMLPVGAEVYLDANCIIYSVERVLPYLPLLQPIWDGARAGSWRICTSELSLLETLVGPPRPGFPSYSGGGRPFKGYPRPAHPRRHPRRHRPR